MEPLAISFLLRSTYDLLPNATNLKLWGYTDSDLCLLCKSDRGTLRHVLSACPQSLQMHTWRHKKSVIGGYSTVWDSKPVTCYCQGTHNSVSQGRWKSCEETKKCQYEATERSEWPESFSGFRDISTISSSHYSNRKAAGHCSMVRFKEECSSYRIDCPLGRKPGGSTRAEEKAIRDTTCQLCGKGLDMPCDSYWGWLSWFSRTLSHFVSFKNRNHWPHFESCPKSSSDHGVKLDSVESEKFSAWMKYMRNHHSRLIT